MKSYTEKLEEELQEFKNKVTTLTTSNDDLREAYKDKSRKCRNWEKMVKALKSQNQGPGQRVIVIDSAQPLFDIPPDENPGDDVYDVEFDDSDQLSTPIKQQQVTMTTTPHTSRVSGIEAQFMARGLALDDLSFLEPDICSLDDWHAEVDAAMVAPSKSAPTRELDKELVSLLVEMKPKGHFMAAAMYYMTHPKQWQAFVRDPIVLESCRCLGIAMETLQPRSLESFRRDHAEVVPDMVANVRHQAHQLERQECIALILQTQPLLQAKHATVMPSPTPLNSTPKPIQHEVPTKVRAENDRMRVIREAKQLENAQRWKDTKDSIRKAATRRSDALQ
ncbi:hypothetical protein DYB34_003769, partial [Aphanomyces astaci]